MSYTLNALKFEVFFNEMHEVKFSLKKKEYGPWTWQMVMAKMKCSWCKYFLIFIQRATMGRSEKKVVVKQNLKFWHFSLVLNLFRLTF